MPVLESPILEMKIAHIVGHNVDIVRQILLGVLSKICPLQWGTEVYLPRPSDTIDSCLATQTTFSTNLPCDTRDLVGEDAQTLRHAIDSFLQVQHFTAHVDGDTFGQVPACHGFCYLSNGPHLVRQIHGHQIDIVQQILYTERV